MSRAKGKNLITFGAPGTGKSYSVLGLVKKAFVDNGLNIPEDIDKLTERVAVRTTFHPDSDYSTFVGCYKPQDLDGKGTITYKFTAQAFINAYLNAWSTEEPYFLIIEEINRGNCAQIFGDVFQILDRKPDGTNEYDITPDADIQKYIETWFKDENHKPTVDIPEEIKNGSKLYLPQNLTLLATMNTSDQSLFPMDSAFKRRWEWHYQQIQAGKKARKIDVGGSKYSWWSFIQNVNERIYKVTKSEDKQLGYWFVKVNDKVREPISSELFVSKVIFYLWSDVFKDYGNSNDSPFSVQERAIEGETANETKKEHFTFQSFFGEKAKENLIRFLDGLNVKSSSEEDSYEESEGEQSSGESAAIRVVSKKKAKAEIKSSEFVQQYKNENPEFKFSSDEVYTNCEAKVTFPYRDPVESFDYDSFTVCADRILETIGSDSYRLFKDLEGGANGYGMIVPTNINLPNYGSKYKLKGELEGYYRLTNYSGNDMRDLLYKMLNLVEKKEDLFTIEIRHKAKKNKAKKK